ncbi:hypothetical protein ABH922_003021 [Rhodococcus sp. 27YEA15]|uniref:hypothetical protein n=1 Tax=Rhodococcus sp. 27YEA15 TaxID=3156259 RepID=UPI003C7E8AB0
MTDIVERATALAAAATSGPWRVETEERFYENTYIGGEWLPDIMVDGLLDIADAEFIAAARTLVPALVAGVQALRATVAEALSVLDRYDHSDDGDLPECATGDRWRLYRDLTAVLTRTLETKP